MVTKKLERTRDMNLRYISMRSKHIEEVGNLLVTFKGSLSLQEIMETPIPLLYELYRVYETVKPPGQH